MGVRNWVSVIALATCTLGADVGRAGAPALKGAQLVTGQLEAQGEGRFLVAGAERVQLKLDAQMLVDIEPGTQFRMGALTKVPIGAGPDPMVPTRVIFLQRGRIDVNMPDEKRPRSACLLFGPDEVRIIGKGGHALMIASDAGITTASQRGEALVSTGGAWGRLPEGAARFYNERWPDGLRRSFPGAPSRPLLSRSLLMDGSGAESSTIAGWTPTSAGSSYELALTDEKGALDVHRGLKEPRLVLSALKPGRYQLTVRVIDDVALESAWSEPAQLNVVGVEAPDTASVEPSGVVHLQPAQRVRLLGASGLEVGYLGYDHFLPAPQSLGLVAQRPITVLLRHPETLETVQVRLEPLTVHAEIEFSREPVRWPAQGLPVVIHLRDQNGRPVSQGFRADVQISVNLIPLAPDWRREGGTLSAQLEQPSLKGPWLVRVSVVDERGAALGMDFAEIGYKSPQAKRGN